MFEFQGLACPPAKNDTVPKYTVLQSIPVNANGHKPGFGRQLESNYKTVIYGKIARRIRRFKQQVL